VIKVVIVIVILIYDFDNCDNVYIDRNSDDCGFDDNDCFYDVCNNVNDDCY
jgi:hypothetical protein